MVEPVQDIQDHQDPSGFCRFPKVVSSVSNQAVSQTRFPGRLHDSEIEMRKDFAISAVMHDL